MAESDTPAPARSIELWCFVCLYVRPKPGLDDDAQGELEMLTVVDGLMVCLRHVPMVHHGPNASHHTLMNAVRFESDGEFESLSAYQDWRGRQDREATDG